MCSDKELKEIKLTGSDSNVQLAEKIKEVNEEVSNISKQTEKRLRAILL